MTDFTKSAKIFAPLKFGDEIRVIAPSSSWYRNKKTARIYARAQERLESLGFKITFGDNIREIFHQGTADRKQRAADFNAAYADRNVRAVLALGGGWSANEILPLIDWRIVRENPKPLIGFSDITVLLNAIYAKTGDVQFLGPGFNTFGRMTEWKYTLNNFAKVLGGENYSLARAKTWGERGTKSRPTKPWKIVQTGSATAKLLGGNLGTFYLLQGTEFCPDFCEPFIFLLEDDDEALEYTAREVSRRFESLLQLPHFRENLRGIIVGRFQTRSKIKSGEIENILLSKNLSPDIPIVANVDFGHTLPILTLPIGGEATLSLAERRAKILI